MKRVLVLLVLLIATDAVAASPKQTAPPFGKLKAAAEALLAAQADYRPGDLISRGEASALLARAAELGFTPPDAADLLGRVPGDGEYLVVQFRTPAGKRFMRKVARYPEAFDRLERLSRLPHGKQTIEDLIRGPGGEELIKYMTTSPGGRHLGAQLGNAPSGADFNKPTGRIYTAEQFIGALEQSYNAAQKQSYNAAQKKPTSTGGRS